MKDHVIRRKLRWDNNINRDTTIEPTTVFNRLLENVIRTPCNYTGIKSEFRLFLRNQLEAKVCTLSSVK